MWRDEDLVSSICIEIAEKTLENILAITLFSAYHTVERLSGDGTMDDSYERRDSIVWGL